MPDSTSKSDKPALGRRLASRLGGALDKSALVFMRRIMESAAPRDIERACADLTAAAAFYKEVDLFSTEQVPNQVKEYAGRNRFGCKTRDLSFQTPYHPKNKAYVEEFASYFANQTCYARHYQAPNARATAILVHGWGRGPFSIEEQIFPVKTLLANGFSVLLFQLPFHGARAPTQAKRSGQLFPSAEVIRTNETFGQIISELRLLHRWLRDQSHLPIGVMGMSVGAYTGALWTSLDDDIAFCSAIIPVCNLAELFWEHGKNSPLRQTAKRLGYGLEHLEQAFACHSPLRRHPKLPPARLHIVAGRGDEIATESQTMTLWNHWNQPALSWFSGGHIMQLGRGNAFKSLLKHLLELPL